MAVGGPITRIIDGYAADFQRENPAIKITPIYAGTYQDTLTKAQTALKANAGPQMAVLLSTDAFSLIDDDLIVGTHGRSIWILDDISPLREVPRAKLRDALLLHPAPAYRVARSTWTDTPIPPDEPRE